MKFLIKVLLTALIVAGVSEIGKRSTLWAAVLASLPLTSILAITWLYLETEDTQRVTSLTQGILWSILPSLVFFIVLPVLLKQKTRFDVAMALSCAITFVAYWAYVAVMKRMGVSL